MSLKNLDIDRLNSELRHKTPDEIINWALTLTENRIVTTSFGIYSAVLLTTIVKFSEVVKLEPFRRGLKETNPDLWFTNIRVRQTEYRNKKNILSFSKEGILKVSPFYYWSDADLDTYIEQHKLPKNVNYFDPIKALQNRECGIHLE